MDISLPLRTGRGRPSATDTIERSDETADLESFGYQQQLHRSLSPFASFAAGFSFISVLTAVFQLTGLGFSFGGPAFIWTWPAVFVGQLFVALCFAELAGRYPISGAIYQWSSRLGGKIYGWFAGWIMLIGQTVVATVAAVALQLVLPAIWSGFQIIGTDSDLLSPSGGQNAVLLAGILLVLTTIANIIGVRLISIINNCGVICELSGALAIVVLLLTHSQRGGEALLSTGTVPHAGYFGALLCASFTAAYVLVGFDSASELSEETRNARLVTPRTTVRALVVAGILGFLVIAATILAAPSLTDGRLIAEGPSYVISSLLSGTTGRILLVMVAIAICVATLAVQTAGSRMLFSMARDGQLPGAKYLAVVPRRTGTPTLAVVLIGALAISILLINLGSQTAFVAIESTCIVLIYLAYMMVTVAMLRHRFRNGHVFEPGHVDDNGRQVFSMRSWGLWVNICAVAYGLFMFVNLIWPRMSMYDPNGGHWYLQFFPLLFTGGTVVVGLGLYLLARAERVAS